MANSKKVKDFNKLWASQIYRAQRGEKEFLFALVRKKYGDRDVETVGPGEYVGVNQVPTHEMTTDVDPDSDTYGERIPKEQEVYDGAGNKIKQKVQTGIDWIFVDEATPENLKKYRGLVGSMPKPFGDTQFYWLFGPKNKFQAHDVVEFFETPIQDARDSLVRRNLILRKAKKKNTPKKPEDDQEEDDQ